MRQNFDKMILVGHNIFLVYITSLKGRLIHENFPLPLELIMILHALE